MLKVNYHHLYYFKVIATEGSVSKAAEKLRLGQPTLSMQLKQFEEFLGHPLFERRNRSLQLTEMGHLVLSYANEIFRLGDELMDSIQDRPLGLKGKNMRLQIGSLESIPKTIVKSLLHKAYSLSECQISVFEGKGPDLIQDLLDHQIDLVLTNEAPPVLKDKKFSSRLVARLQLIICGTPAFASAANHFPQSLQNQPFILSTTGTLTRSLFDRYMEANNISVQIVAEAQDTGLMKSLALDGRGLIVMPELAVNEYLRSKDLVKIGELFGVYEEIWLISTSRKIQNPVADQLMKQFNCDLVR